MKISYWGLLFAGALFYTVSCKPTDDDDPSEDEYVQDGEVEYDDYSNKQEEDIGENDPKVPVRIVTKPMVFTKNVNETVILPCNITAGNSVVQLWRKNETPLFQAGMKMGDAHQNMQYQQDGSLKIQNIAPEDSGNYKCEMLVSENPPSVTHELIVLSPPKILLLNAANNITKLKVGDTLRLTCSASGYPKPQISWHKGAERLGDEGKTLTIENIKHRDAGSYRCLADNKIGQPAPAQIDIKIDFKPMVQLEKILVNSDTNHNAELKCIVHAEPRASVFWQMNGKNVINSEHTQLSHSGHNHILLIKDLQESDFGIYTCSAINSVGSTQKNISLIKTPAILEFVKPQKGVKDVVLTWRVESKSPISEHELQYRKRGTNDWITVKPEITDDEEGVYMVKYTLKRLDFGVYETRLRSQNGHGWSEYSEIMPFDGVFAKSGKHKNNRKEMKDKHNKVTQETIPTNEMPPPELLENDSVVGASQPSGASLISTTSSLLLLALLLHFRQ